MKFLTVDGKVLTTGEYKIDTSEDYVRITFLYSKSMANLLSNMVIWADWLSQVGDVRLVDAEGDVNQIHTWKPVRDYGQVMPWELRQDPMAADLWDSGSFTEMTFVTRKMP